MLDDEEISKLATCESEREIEKHDGELMQILAKWFDKPLSELPEQQRRHAGLYIKKWSELSPGERRACATEADRKIQQTIALRFQQARREQEGLPSDRFAQRAMQDGFDKATREKDGERDFESEIEEVNMLVERCMELARKEALTIADWIEITGIGRGKHGAYLVKRKSVSFIKWERSLIAGWPPSNQADMERENETAPLSFPCPPARLIQFIDTLPVEIHAFRVPDAFRQAVTEIVQATDATPQVPGNALETTTANEAGLCRFVWNGRWFWRFEGAVMSRADAVRAQPNPLHHRPLAYASSGPRKAVCRPRHGGQ